MMNIQNGAYSCLKFEFQTQCNLPDSARLVLPGTEAAAKFDCLKLIFKQILF